MDTPQPVVALEQGFPGRRADLPASAPRSRRAERLLDRRLHVLVVAAERGGVVERFGLGVALRANGPTFLGASLLVASKAAVTHQLEAWCAAQSPPLAIATLAEHFDWRSGTFRADVYSGGGFLVGADLGRSLGLVCEWTAATGRWSGGFSLWPRTWSREVERRGGRRSRESRSPHLPPIRITTAGAHGYLIEFARPPGGRGTGKRNADGSHYRGRFLDVVPAAFGLDGIDSDRLGDHLIAFGLPAAEVPSAVACDEKGAAELYDAARAILALAYRLDAEVAS